MKYYFFKKIVYPQQSTTYLSSMILDPNIYFNSKGMHYILNQVLSYLYRHEIYYFDNSLGFNHISAKLDAIDQNQVQDTD